MSTPIRDNADGPTVPPPVAPLSDGGPAPSVTAPVASERDAWRDPVQRTDEIELLISAAVFFGLLQVPGRLTGWWTDWVSHQTYADAHFGLMLMQISYGIVFALLASFLVHIILRGFWIGLIGLRSVFPQGVDWENLSRRAPITTEYQRPRIPTLDVTIAKVDRVASVVFISASLLVGMTLAGALFLMPVILFGIVRVEWLLGILVLFLLPVLVQLVLDRGIAARSPRWAAMPWLRRLVLASGATYGLMTPRVLWTPMLTLQSRLHEVGYGVGVMLMMIVVMLAFPLHLFVERASRSSDAYELIDDAITRHGFTQPESPSVDASNEYPWLGRIQVNGPWVELFVPLRPPTDDAELRANCPAYALGLNAAGVDAARAHALRDCLAGLWRFALDGVAIEADAFELARKGSQRGLVAMLPTAELASGRHQIVATRVRTPTPGQTLREPPPPRSLLFWVAH